MTDALQSMGITDADMQKALEATRFRYRRNPGVCICGHNAKSHYSQSGEMVADEAGFVESCNPTRQACPCSQYREIIRASNVRFFVHKTEGAGADHALTKGLYALHAAGGSEEYTEPWDCDACGGTHLVWVTPVTRTRRPSLEATGWNFLLCAECRGRLVAGTLFNHE